MSDLSKQLDHIAPVVRVKDMMRSLDFYRERLGFELEFLYEGFYGSVLRDGCHIHLQCGTPAQRDPDGYILGFIQPASDARDA